MLVSDLERAVRRRLGELPYSSYLCAVHVICRESCATYMKFMSDRARQTASMTLDEIKLCIQDGRHEFPRKLSEAWYEIVDNPKEDGPAGLLALFMALGIVGEELLSEANRYESLDWITTPLDEYPTPDDLGPEAKLVEINAPVVVDERSFSVKLLRRAEILLDGLEHRSAPPQDPDHFRLQVLGPPLNPPDYV